MSRGVRAAGALIAAVLIACVGAGTATAASNSFFGLDAVSLPTQAQLNRAAQGGAGYLRIQLLWPFVEPSPGQRFWRDDDALIGAAAQAGLTVLPDLYSVPKWLDRDPSNPPIHSARARAAWSQLLTDYAARYGTSGTFWAAHPEIPKHPITTWEIWNEPNLGGFFGGKPNPRGYAELLKISSIALRAGDPAAQVVTAGFFPVHTIKHTVDMKTYLNALYRVPGVTNYFDAIGLHPYWRTPKGVLHWVRQARGIINAHGDAATPIWVTEFGWVTGGVRFKFSPLRSTLRQQAHRLTTTFGLLRGNAGSLNIAHAFWFSYTDHDTPGGPDFWTDRAGLFRLNGRPKPAWYAFTKVAGGTP
jgi:polysaccharide biosynthesis protein PslG